MSRYLDVRNRFQRMKVVPLWLRPAIGGLVTGVLAVVALRLLHSEGITEEVMQLFPKRFQEVSRFARCWSCDIDKALLHHNSVDVGAFALVAMGAAFAGIFRAPITSVLIIFEMTEAMASSFL